MSRTSGEDQEELGVVVVGAGSSGATLAARLSEDGSRTVLLVERGRDGAGLPDGDLLDDPDRVPAADDPHVRAAVLFTGDGDRTTPLLAGNVLGGSSAVNGAYFVRPTDDDLSRWAAAGNDRWGPEQVLATMRRLESDAELGTTPRHGATGPMPVTRHARPTYPVTDAFFVAASQGGHPEQPDLNGGGSLGWGLVPRNVDTLGRVSSARAYLDPARARPNLQLRDGRQAQRIVIDGGRAVGVELADTDGTVEVVRAATVVLSAGALGSAELLRRSGVGPADELRLAGVEVAVDAPGVGTVGSNHPAIDLLYEPTGGVSDGGGPLVQGALHLSTASGAIVEIMATCRPYGRASLAAPDDSTLSLRVSVMSVPNRVRLSTGEDRSIVDAGYLNVPELVVDLRDAVRAATELANSAPLSPMVRTWLGPDPATVRDDVALDAWIAARLGTSMHLCATARMGPPSDLLAVVDQFGRVRGVDGRSRCRPIRPAGCFDLERFMHTPGRSNSCNHKQPLPNPEPKPASPSSRPNTRPSSSRARPSSRSNVSPTMCSTASPTHSRTSPRSCASKTSPRCPGTSKPPPSAALGCSSPALSPRAWPSRAS
ncbi:MAG: GMC family oxidoreductase [Microthrixaceae bacterium]